MKKLLSLLLILTLSLGLLAGCIGAPAANGEAHKLSIVCTIFPLYDWTRQLLGDRASEVELTLLLDDGVDLHSFQPTADDIIRISDCDLFLYVGGESDEWVDDALQEARNQDMVVLNMLDLLGDAVKTEETVEGMEAEAEEEEEDEPEYDEHVWLSLRNAATLCAAISEALVQLDPAGKSVYDANTAAYLDELSALDADYQAAVDGAIYHTVVFGDRFPFRYLTDDYGLDYYAAFAGCSAETEASFETIVFLADKVDELGLPAILRIETSDDAIPLTIRQNTVSQDQQICVLDSMQAVTGREAESGVTYLGLMQANLEALRLALN